VSNSGVRLRFLTVITIVLFGLLACKPHPATQPRPANPARQNHPAIAPLDADLLHAARKGDTAAVDRLLRQGAKVNAKDEQNSTALSLAADYGHLDTARFLLAHGADLTAARLKGDADLVNAAEESMSTRVALIVEHGVSRDAANKALFEMAGFAPLIIVMKSPSPLPPLNREDWIHTDEDATVKLLLQHGASLDARNETGATPLIWAATFGHDSAVRLFLKHGAKVDARDTSGATALIDAACECAIIDMPETYKSMKLLLDHGAQVDARDKSGRTALMDATIAGRTKNMRLLLDHAADLNARDNDGNTPLLLSAGAGYTSSAAVIYTVEPIKLLLSHGANIEDRDKRGNTPLMLAAAGDGYESAAAVKLLLAQGADPAARNSKGQTALDIALKHHRVKIMALLRPPGHQSQAPSISR